MTPQEFDDSNFVARMTCVYRHELREIVSVDLVERLLGLGSTVDADDLPDFVRCENVSDVSSPSHEV